MSVVLINKDQIAQDHLVVFIESPPRYEVCLDNKKIFRSPSNKYFVGICGQFEQSLFEKESTWNSLDAYFKYLNAETSGNSYSEIDIDKLKNEIKNTFSDIIELFLVSKTDRYKVIVDDVWSVIAGEISGIGTGGFYGEGLLIGGFSMDKTFDSLYKLCLTVSRERTIYDLNTLDDWNI